MATIAFDPAAFVALFPAFNDATQYPVATLDAYAAFAANYVDTSGYSSLTTGQQTLTLQLMTAHLLQLIVNGASGQPVGFQTSRTVRDVSYTVAAPPGASQFQWWLNLTPYGAQLYTLLSMQAVGGLPLIGGFPETLALRRFGGFY